MVILYRYLSSSILQATFAVTLILLLIVTSGRLAKYLTQASNGELAANLVMWIILYRIPDFLPLIIPLGLFVGILLAYGRFYVDSEMTILNACGVGKSKVLFVTLIPAFWVSVLVAFLTLWTAPASLAKVESLLEESKNTLGVALFREGKFQSDKQGDSVAYIEQLPSKDTFKGIFIVEQKKDGSIVVVRAKDGEVIETDIPDLNYIKLNAGVIYEGSIGNSDYQITRFGSYSEKVLTTPPEEQRQLRIDALPTAQLFDADNVLHVAALHWRFSLPATVIVVAVLAMALSKTDRRRGRYTKMLPAIVIYLLYIISLSGVRSLVEESRIPVSALWLVHLGYLGFALFLLYQEDLQRYMKSQPVESVLHVGKR